MLEQTRENEREFHAQSYWRLLKYTRKYWTKLTLGIVAGLLVGGSLLVSLLMIPQLVGVVDPNRAQIASRSDVHSAASPVTGDAQLDKMLATASQAARKYHLPFSIDGRLVKGNWPCEFQFEIVDSRGRMAWQLFALYVLLFVLAWALKNVGIYINHYYTRWVGGRVVADMRAEIFHRLINQSLKYYGNMDIGHLISRCTNDTSVIEAAVSNSVGDLTSAPIQIFACLAAVFIACRSYNNYTLVLVIIIGAPLVVLPVHIIGRRIRRVSKSTFAKIADVFSRMHEVFTGIRVVKAYYTEKHEYRRFVEVNNNYFREAVRAMKLQLLLSPSMEVIAVASTLVFLVFSYSQGVTLSQLAALLAPAMMAYQPIKALSKVVSSIQRSMAAADRYFDMIDTDMSLPEKPHAVELKEFRDSIELKEAVFSYDDQRIIDGVSFRIPRGSMVAVVGETGSGKTTVANLIARFYDVTGGAVLIDGVDVRDYSIASLRRMIGVVTQEAILFNDTIANNIAYGSLEASREDVIKAAKLANAHEFIVDGRHAEGYDTGVGEKGFKLSGGEKQRVAIARAILQNPPILILDEATSALDTVTERLVQDALNRVMSNRTVFAIAHRLSTIRSADTILVLKHGKIAEAGTHEELLAKNGLYRKLHDTQFDLNH